MNESVFVTIEEAAKTAGMSIRQFRRIAPLVGLSPIRFSRKAYTSHRFVRTQVLEKKTQMQSLTGQSRKPYTYSRPRLPGA